MGKVLTIVGVVLFLYWAIPHFARAEWLAPAPIYPDWWGYQNPYYNPQIIARQTSDATWQRFDFWNSQSY